MRFRRAPCPAYARALILLSPSAPQIQVVCGATNLVEGAVTAFAPLGSSVRMPTAPGGRLSIADTKIRGVQSSGMLCGLGELDLLPEGASATQEIQLGCSTA